MPNLTFSQFADWFRKTSPYINNHRDKCFVVHLASGALASEQLASLSADLSLLNSLGIKLVLSFSVRRQLKQELEAAGLDWQEQQGRLLVDKHRLASLINCVGKVRHKLEAQLSLGLANSPQSNLKLMSGNLVTAKPLGVHQGQDMHFCGAVRKVDAANIHKLLDAGMLVLLPPLGFSATGDIFDLPAEELALQAAISLKADKLILLGEAEGLTQTAESNANPQLVRDLTPSQAEAFLASNQLSAETQRHLAVACQACQAGVARSHLLSYVQQGALLQELFSREGAGTLVTQESYETLRQAKLSDVASLLALLKPLEEAGVLVRRSRELLEAEINQFKVIDLDGSLIACAALYPYPETNQAEVAAVVVHPDYRSKHRGEKLLQAIEKAALAKGISEIFVLTTQTAHWFLEQGFYPAQIEQLPASKRAMYNWQRNSKVFYKELNSSFS